MSSEVEQVQRYIEARALPEPNSGCWLWELSVGSHGYPQGFHPTRKRISLAHRLSYTAYKGDIPEGFDVDHLCRVKICVNPDHLEATTPFANRRRQAGYRCDAVDVPKECPRGHPYQRNNGKLYCRVCAGQ
jgi:hypothetical protein